MAPPGLGDRTAARRRCLRYRARQRFPHDERPADMTASVPYAAEQPDAAQVAAMAGPAVLEFGANWCGICKAAQPLIAEAFADHAALPHLKVEDGSGRPLGRAFGVKLWPTLVFLRDGKEVARVVRPDSAQAVRDGFAQIGA